MKKLSREQWEQLDCQMAVTPDPLFGESGTGEHARLTCLLNTWGYHPHGRMKAYNLGLDLWDEGYEEESN